MGSFTEVVLNLNFQPHVPDQVLAAFSALASTRSSTTAPSLPTPVVEAWDDFQPDWRDDDIEDPYVNEPWRHDWATWMSTSMGVGTTSHGHLVWSEMERWNLDCRFSWKTLPVGVSEAIEWLGPYVDDSIAVSPILVGYAHHEYAPRPHLLWIGKGALTVEDLNPNDEWTWG